MFPLVSIPIEEILKFDNLSLPQAAPIEATHIKGAKTKEIVAFLVIK
jgi:hypothetical protein